MRNLLPTTNLIRWFIASLCAIVGAVVLICFFGQVASRRAARNPIYDGPPVAPRPELATSLHSPLGESGSQSRKGYRAGQHANVRPIPDSIVQLASANQAQVAAANFPLITFPAPKLPAPHLPIPHLPAANFPAAVLPPTVLPPTVLPDTESVLAQQVHLAAQEMRQLDRTELPERRTIAARLYQRLCDIGERLDAEVATHGPHAQPHSIWALRDSEAQDHRSIIRSLLAAVAIAPEKSAFVSAATRRILPSSSTSNPESILVAGDVTSIQDTHQAWLFAVRDPFTSSESQYMVRVDHDRLHQPVSIGNRIVILGNGLPHDHSTTDTPIIATEIYAIKQ